MNKITRRHFSSSLLKTRWARYYDQSNHPVIENAPKNLKWLWNLPDPPAYPKTIQKTLDDGSVFHQFIRRKPLYEYVDVNTTPKEVIEKTLPPIVFNPKHGRYSPRLLKEVEIDEIQKLAVSKKVPELAEQFKCSKYQISQLVQQVLKKTGEPNDIRYEKIRPKWSWWFKKKYAKSQIDYYQ